MVALRVCPLIAQRHGGASLVDGVSVTKASADVRPGERAERRFGAGTAAVKRRTASIALFHRAVVAQTADELTVRDTGREKGIARTRDVTCLNAHRE